MEGVSIRQAAPADTERIAELVAGEPGREAIGIAGCAEAARSFGLALVRLPNSPQGWQCSTIGELDRQIVGVLQTSHGDTEPFRLTPRMALLVVRIFGTGIVSVLGRYRARLRVNPKLPPDAYYIAELDVDPAYRNRGIGGAMLDYAEEDARRLGFSRMSLVTTTINPARHLYERHGLRVTETKTDPTYERYTGIAGRHLMVKELT